MHPHGKSSNMTLLGMNVFKDSNCMARVATLSRPPSANSIASPSRDDFAAMLEQSFVTQSPQEGQVIKGTIVAIEKISPWWMSASRPKAASR